ncbi:MAG TPA: 5'-3' exonuclease H3TH domain-containing protein [Steroidobacteraceae bacterium]|nr:5'-3' exonuclease H3TH domain-containing protein [Steroidobacteraceae bacterium]
MIFLVDASVYVFRAYYSLPPEMVDRDGEQTHAVFGFARFLCDLMERAQPALMAVAFDQSLSSCFRNRIYPPYKANREPAPPGLALQLERCFEFCALAGVAAVRSCDYEADDLIGSLVARMRVEGVRATLITRDKDFAQLVREGDVLWDYAGRDPLSYGEVERRFGVAPERFADYLALTGDAVDNIPGVPGIGPKTASVLMREFAGLDELYDGIDRVEGLKLRGASSVRARLLAHREAAYLARRLTAIACDVPLDLPREALRRRAPDLGALAGFFDRQGFGALLRRQVERLAQSYAPETGI